MDVNRRKWRWWQSTHVQCVHRQLTFQRNSSHFKYRMFLLEGFDYETWQETKRRFIFSCVAHFVKRGAFKSNSHRNWDTHMLTYMGTYLHMQPSCSKRAARQKVMTPPLSVWTTGAIDRWPSRLFTVKAPSIALLHYVTFNRALTYWNSAPWYTFYTIHIPFSLQYIQFTCSYVLITLPLSNSLVKLT